MKAWEFAKWLFGKIFNLPTAKMIIFLLFLSFIAWLGYKYFLEKEDVEYKSATEKVAE
jgi:hypothetical protein